MGYIPTGYYGGLFLGRLLLAEPTFRLGEKRMVLVYCGICLGLQLLFWLVPNIIANATALSLMGFFYGPFFATVSLLSGKASNPILLTGCLPRVGCFRGLEDISAKGPSPRSE